jgi:cytochrome c556
MNIKMPHKKIMEKLMEIDIKDGKFGEEAKTGKFFTATDKIKTDNPKPKDPDKLKKELKELEKKYGTEDNA